MATFASSTNDQHNFAWQQTMLRIKDPKVTVPFFENHFGFTLIHYYNFPQWNFSLYFLAILPAGQTYTLTPGSKDAEDYLWSTDLTTLELTHNHGSEADASFAVNNGNVEPHRGFGHIALMTPDVYAACAELEAAGVKFQKKPDDGRMKGLAFVLSPEGYWIEIIRRSEQAEMRSQGLKYTFAQVLLYPVPSHSVLCCAVLCCAVLCCAVLCCAVLCCAVLCCGALCCAVLCCAACCAACCVLWCAVVCCGVLCSAVQCYAACCAACCGVVWCALCCAVLCSVQCCGVLWCAVLCCAVLCCAVLYYRVAKKTRNCCHHRPL